MGPEDEQRLTAYVLDELNDEERAEVEALLEASPEARSALEDIRRTAELLEAELGQETCPELTEERAAAIMKQAGSSPKRRWAAIGLALAASLALLAGSLYVLWQSMPAREKSNLRTAKLESAAGFLNHDSETIPAEVREQMEALGYLSSEEVEKPGGPPPPPPPPPPSPEELTRDALVDLARKGEASSGADAKAIRRFRVTVGETEERAVEEYRIAGAGPQAAGAQQADGSMNIADVRGSGGGAYRGGAYGGGGRGGDFAYNGTWVFQGGEAGSAVQGGGRVLIDPDGDGDTIVAPGLTPVAKPGSPSVEELMALGYVGGSGGGGTVVVSGDSYEVRTLNRSQIARVSGEVAGAPRGPDVSSAEDYQRIVENPFLPAAQHPLSTFSIDVDTASYANVRRFLTQGQWPPADAVRIEEMVNYFTYDYAPPENERPFAVHAEVAGCPWTPEHRLVRIGLKGREIDPAARKPCNLVFLLDASGSMGDENKLPLLKKALSLLVGGLNKSDTVAIVTFANEAQLHLSPTTCDQKQVLRAAIDELAANGGTNGGAGVELAYDLAKEHAVEDGVNRVIVGTDGDFNQGVTEKPELVKLIQDCAKSGVFLTVLGLGEGNLQDGNLEALADKGNGNYAYIDTFNEARRVLCEQMAGTLITIAKDVKVQVEFNPGKVSAYRLIGYENRVMAARDFNDDRKDAGDIGSGHTVTALYEVVPVGVSGPMPGVDNLRFQQPPEPPENLKESDELLWVKLRYKEPEGAESALIEFPLTDAGKGFDKASADTRFAAAVAAFGMLLRDSDAKGNTSFESILAMARAAKGADPQGYRAEFVNLVTTAQSLKQ